MTYSPLIVIFVFLFGGNAQPNTLNDKENISEIIYKQNTKNIGPVYIGMTGAQIEELGLPYTITTENMEGDEYTIYLVNLSDSAILKCIFDLDGHLSIISTSSQTVTDKFGNGAGSTVQDLHESYPNGRFIYGSAEGSYVVYTTGSMLRFRFDYKDMPESCFETGGKCNVPIDIRVKKFEIR
ncbi:MAG: hypothetical protein JKY46_04895 [Robiginitomaculum sp.]|nr:hypothetical protein [Robiginitomaculum sp.]